ncbi:hypothetical protein [Chryseobacterium sp. 5_R23647]|uniref:hypothetical protein n=1 Tax=Chryseobacterium sp. 5_R23647 TaxID=2258964 RepID=UPI000E22C2F8|nr:hypothetical protein [Chryseobacterium sp. 5_R23647]REC42582.1 hypothetical protein DRF69_11030 [Chryseobacterium sp. 5_R23647]
MQNNYKLFTSISFVLGIVVGNFITTYYKDKQIALREDARADVVSLLYEEKLKRNKDSIEYNEIINQASETYYKLLTEHKK